MKKNGFTLIELLAIIVILAIIAIITTPIILGIIENSKKGAAIDSAYGYKEAIEKYYVSKKIDDTGLQLQSGYKLISDMPSDFTVSGEQPSDGWVKLNKGTVEAYSLKIGDYVVTKYVDSDVVAVKGGEVAENEEMRDLRLAKEATINSANTYISMLEGLTTKIISQTKSYSELNQLVELESEANAGWVEFDSSGNATRYSLKFGDYVVNYDSSLTSNQQTVTTGNTLVPGVVDLTDGAKYYTGVLVTYYNPGSSTVSAGSCTETEYNNNTDKNGTTGCLKWYAYSEKGNYVNMILDHNVNVGCSGDACKWAASNNSEGPVLALTTLDSYTSSWQTETPKVPNKYGIDGAESNPQIVPASANDNKYSIDYSNYKARLITKEEVDRIKAANSNSIPSGLYENLSESLNGTYEYWTSSPRADHSYFACSVFRSGTLSDSYVDNTTSGVRPVITVANS